jgi:hypothetical protein
LAYGGNHILERYEYSVAKALMDLYPFEDWQFWRFGIIPKDYCEENYIKYFQWLANELYIQHPWQWYTIKLTDLKKFKGSQLLKHAFDNDLARFFYFSYEIETL